MSTKRRWLRRSRTILLTMVLMVSGFIALAYILNLPATALVMLASVLRLVGQLALYLQVALAIALLWKWPQLLVYGRRRRWVGKAELRTLLGMRAQVAVALLVYLLLVAIGPARIAHLFLFIVK